MEGKRRREPVRSSAAGRVAEAPETAGPALPFRKAGVRYDPDELFPDSPRLSERERETLEFLVDGKTNADIAKVMGNSKRTVENFIGNLTDKLAVADRNEAVALYHRAVEAKLEREIARLFAEVRVLTQQNAALRRQLRRHS